VLELSHAAVAARDTGGDQGTVEQPLLVALATQTEDRKGPVKGLPQRHLLDVGLRNTSFDSRPRSLSTTTACL